MPIEIKLNGPERIRRAKKADPSLSEAELSAKFRVSVGQVKLALAYRQPGQKAGRKRA